MKQNFQDRNQLTISSRRPERIFRLLICVLTLCVAPVTASDLAAPQGLLVERTWSEFGGAMAGIEAGDWIVSWSRGPIPTDPEEAAGKFETPFDLWRVIFEQAPLGQVTVYGHREGREKAWSLPPSRWWGLDTRPALADDVLRRYEEARSAFRAGQLDRGLSLWREAAEILESRGETENAAWIDRLSAVRNAEAVRWQQSDEAIERGISRLAARREFWNMALLQRWIALGHQQAGDFGPARRHYLRALELSRLEPPNLSETKVLIGLGAVADGEGDLAAAEGYFLEALRITERIAPESLDRAECLADLGEIAVQRGDLVAADHWNREALAVQERLAPCGLDIGITFQTLAEIASQRGFLTEAESLFRRSLEVTELNLPGSPSAAKSLSLLATLALRRGNLAVAEEYLQRSLELFGDEPNEQTYNFSEVLVTLAGIAVQRGELASAHSYLTRALAAREETSSSSSGVADALLSLGRLAALRGEPAEARHHMERSLAIRRRQSERSIHVAAILRELGSLPAGSGMSASAGEAMLIEAVSILEQEVPGSLAEAGAQIALGRRLAERGSLVPALRRFSRAFEIRSRLAPGSVQEAEALYRLGLAKRKLGRRKEATEDLCSAVDLLDRQRQMFGGAAESKAYFEATVVPYYEECLRGLLARGRAAEAFAVLERGRARAFLALVSERELRPSELPPDLVAERWKLGGDYDRLQEALSRLSPERDQAEVERLRAALAELRNRQEALANRIGMANPHAASLHRPRLIDLAGARSLLDPGTVFLSYAVGEENTLLFIVESADRGGRGLTVRALPIGRRALEEEVERLRRSMKSSEKSGQFFRIEAERLYRLLIRPADPILRSAARILICPDGPLHALPFAALRRRGEYLAEWKPIHFAPSASAYAELGKRRPPSSSEPELALAAFGGPTSSAEPSGAPGDAEVRSAVRRGLKLDPLPFSREEAAETAALFPGGRAFVGDQATEEEVKRIAPRARILHFACHGLLDEQMPLNSGLALAIPNPPAEGRENGILQAWEIFDNLRLDADLVTLSACDTALGKEMGGEGVLGLTRAFQFAGARSVLSSLWSVEDESTATLMRAFYLHLRRGENKDQALRAAQLQLIRSQTLSHPYYWAAFQLFGSWK